MDFINKAFAQLTDLFRSMTAGARITTALLLVVVVLSLAYLFRYHAAGPSLYLLNERAFSTEQQQAMAAAFGKAGLKGWSFDGPKIRIPRSQEDKFLAALSEHDALPEIPDGPMDKAIETSTFSMDPQQRQEMFKQAHVKKVSSIIRAMTGIQNAWVMYDAEKRRGFGQENLATASVSVVPSGSEPLPGATIAAIRRQVLFSFAELRRRPENVVVIDIKHRRSYEGDQEDSASGQDPVILAAQRSHEEWWKQKIRSALPAIEGLLVSVSVELNNEKLRRERQSGPSGKPVAVTVQEKSRTHNVEGSAVGGRAGAVANQPGAVAPVAGKGSKQEEEETSRQETNTVPVQVTESERVPMAVKQVKAVVSIPSSYFQKVWQQRNPASAGEKPKTPASTDLDPIRQEVIARCEKAVAGLLPAPEVATDTSKPEANKLVTVTEFDDFPPAEIPEPGMKEQALGWLGQNWSTLGLVLLALVSLAMVRSMVRAVPSASRPAAAGLTIVTAEPGREEEPATKEESSAQRRLKRLGGTGKTLRDELSELVAENPEAAANVLRTWIGSNS